MGLDLIHPSVPLVRRVADVALFVVLFTDGQESRVRVLRRTWQLPTRALLVGMPLTFVLVALFARYVAGTSPHAAALVRRRDNRAERATTAV